MTDGERGISRRRWMGQAYCVLFGLACGSAATAIAVLINAVGDYQTSADNVRMWLPSLVGVVLGWIFAGRALRQPALHTACRLLGGLVTIVCLGSAGYFFVRQVTSTGWDQIELFVMTLLSLIGAAMGAITAACGFIGRRYLTADAKRD